MQSDAGELGDADAAEEEVDGGEEVVLRGDDEAPARPDGAGGGEGGVLGHGELVGGAREVADSGDDESPFHYGSPRLRRVVVSLVLGASMAERERERGI